MAAKSNAYWEARAARRMEEYLWDSDAAMRVISGAYQQALGNIAQDMARIYGKEARRRGFTPQERWAYLEEDGGRRLATLRERTRQRVAEATEAQLSATEALLRGLARKAYGQAITDLEQGAGLDVSAELPEAMVERMLRNPWSGSDYRERSQRNGEALGREVEETLAAGLEKGRNEQALVDEMRERLAMGYREAERLVDTETVYMAGAAQLAAWEEAGLSEYRFVAVLDSRTSGVCQELDGKVFPIAQAKPRVNMPPMHPNCRSAIAPVAREQEKREAEEKPIREEADGFTARTAQAEIDEIRARMPKSDLRDYGNMAVAEVEIAGVKPRFIAHSRINSPASAGADRAGFSWEKEENVRLFTTYVPDAGAPGKKPYDRYHDTEAKILEDIASQITDARIAGKISLYTERPACQSCTNIIYEFRRMYPNIQLHILTR